MELLVIPAVSAHRSREGRLVLTEKFISGMKAYAERWPGRVTCVVRVAAESDFNLDHQAVSPDEHPFGMATMPSDQNQLAARMRQASVVLGGRRCVPGVSQVLVRECTLRTQQQILAASMRNPIRRMKRTVQLLAGELRGRFALSRAAGVQCNGTPTYNAYRNLNQNAMLYFDSRVEQDDLIDSARLEYRLTRLRSGQPLQLAFTGRLLPIKGVQYLSNIACELRRLHVPFVLHICGGGPSEEAIRGEVRNHQLCNQVQFHGVLRYRDQLLPFLRDNIDLFVCPHVQGDPSCTYIETLACGVPIIGYANEAWSGMVPLSHAGWLTPMRRPDLLASRIAELDRQRQPLVDASREARAFAAQHLFGPTMDRRVEHLLSCLKGAARP